VSREKSCWLWSLASKSSVPISWADILWCVPTIQPFSGSERRLCPWHRLPGGCCLLSNMILRSSIAVGKSMEMLMLSRVDLMSASSARRLFQLRFRMLSLNRSIIIQRMGRRLVGRFGLSAKLKPLHFQTCRLSVQWKNWPSCRLKTLSWLQLCVYDCSSQTSHRLMWSERRVPRLSSIGRSGHV